MKEAPTILALRPGATLTAKDKKTLRDAGIIVVNVAPDDLVAIQSASILPANDMLRYALLTIQNTKLESCNSETNKTNLRSEFAKRVIESLLQLGEVAKP